jgi:hypothetical protein
LESWFTSRGHDGGKSVDNKQNNDEMKELERKGQRKKQMQSSE